jgi:hypothetical protein
MIKTTTSNKKLTPASIIAQKAWGGFSKSLKQELGRKLPDKDKDGVPNGFDCRPKNRRKQESFLPVDATYVNLHSIVTPDKFVGSGASGDVFTIKGNRHMVVKVPRAYTMHPDLTGYTTTARINLVKNRTIDLEEEYNIYTQYGLEHEALFTPTKKVMLAPNDLGLTGVIGLVRPRVRTIYDIKVLNNKQLEMLRKQLVSISEKGLSIEDGLQIGLDKSGKPLLFDLGYVNKTTRSKAFRNNHNLWMSFINVIMVRRKEVFTSMDALLDKYGRVYPDGEY